MDEIAITVNDEPRRIPIHCSVERLTKSLSTLVSGVAVAINGEVIAKETWPSIELKNNDSVLIITATQGG